MVFLTPTHPLNESTPKPLKISTFLERFGIVKIEVTSDQMRKRANVYIQLKNKKGQR